MGTQDFKATNLLGVHWKRAGKCPYCGLVLDDTDGCTEMSADGKTCLVGCPRCLRTYWFEPEKPVNMTLNQTELDILNNAIAAAKEMFMEVVDAGDHQNHSPASEKYYVIQAAAAILKAKGIQP